MITEPRDLVYRENRRGPYTEPRGTPVSKVQGLDKESLHSLICANRQLGYRVNNAKYGESGKEDLVFIIGDRFQHVSFSHSVHLRQTNYNARLSM